MRPILMSVLALACAACTHATQAPAEVAAPAASPAAQAPAPADAFLAAIAAHCGKSYAGRIVANEPRPTTPDAFEGQRLVMHVRGCEEVTSRIEIPFHVGDDHSRTWVLTRIATGLRLKHDHRHEDGAPDVTTMYGGDATGQGSATRQVFPVDAESIALFKREGLETSVRNTWAMEIHPAMFAYELSRPDGRLFRLEFDLGQPVDTPPTPWGW